MADVVLQRHLVEAGLDAGSAGGVSVASSGTGDWHIGHPMDQRAAATLTAAGYDPSRHRAQQFGPPWLEEHDLVLVMDSQNLRDVVQMGAVTSEPGPARVRLFRDFDSHEPGGEVPDPYYGGDSGFEEVLDMVERTCAALVTALAELLDRQSERR